jgi:hypothetical protein
LKGPSENIVEIFAKALLCLISPYFRDETQKTDYQSFFCVSPLTPGNSGSSEVQVPPSAEGGTKRKTTLMGGFLFGCGEGT